MNTIPTPTAAVNPDPDILAFEAVCELRANYLVDRPDDGAAYAPPPTSFTLVDDREPEPPLEELYNVCDLRDDEAPGSYPVHAFEPSEADLADYHDWCREREQRLWDVRVTAAPTFVERLYALVNHLNDQSDPVLEFAGKILGQAADLARHLGATSPESYFDRRDAMMDSIEHGATARACRCR